MSSLMKKKNGETKNLYQGSKIYRFASKYLDLVEKDHRKTWRVTNRKRKKRKKKKKKKKKMKNRKKKADRNRGHR